MKVKNLSNRPVSVGTVIIAGGCVSEVDGRYMYLPRTVRLKQKGILDFPYCCDKSSETSVSSTNLPLDVKDEPVFLQKDSNFAAEQTISAYEDTTLADEETVAELRPTLLITDNESVE